MSKTRRLFKNHGARSETVKQWARRMVRYFEEGRSIAVPNEVWAERAAITAWLRGK